MNQAKEVTRIKELENKAYQSLTGEEIFNLLLIIDKKDAIEYDNLLTKLGEVL